MVNPDLQAYIQKARSVGTPDTQIQEELLRTGWGEADVDAGIGETKDEGGLEKILESAEGPSMSSPGFLVFVSVILALVLTVFLFSFYIRLHWDFQSHDIYGRAGYDVEFFELWHNAEWFDFPSFFGIVCFIFQYSFILKVVNHFLGKNFKSQWRSFWSKKIIVLMFFAIFFPAMNWIINIPSGIYYLLNPPSSRVQDFMGNLHVEDWKYDVIESLRKNNIRYAPFSSGATVDIDFQTSSGQHYKGAVTFIDAITVNGVDIYFRDKKVFFFEDPAKTTEENTASLNKIFESLPNGCSTDICKRPF